MPLGLDQYLPELGFSTGSVISVVTYFVLFIAFCVIAAIITYVIIRAKKFNKVIVLFKKINNRYEPAGKDRATEVKFGESGDSVFYLAKAKKYIPTPQLQTGRNTYWYAVREDDEWINIGIQDIDLAMREVGAKFLDKEMRYARVALQKNLRDRYAEPNFWTKYGGVIAFTGLIVVIGIMSWLLFDKFIEVTGGLAQAIDSSIKVQDASREIVAALDNLCSTSGLRGG